MKIESILLLVIAAFIIRFLPNQNIRRWSLLSLSVVALFWLQPALPIRYLDYFLPIFTIILGSAAWFVITPQSDRWTKVNIVTIIIVASLVLLLSLSRFISVTGVITPSRPPTPWLVAIPFLVAAVGVLLAKGRLQKKPTVFFLLILILLFLLVVLKTPEVLKAVSYSLRLILEQSPERSSPFDIRWLGFSYMAFRLIHTLLDVKNNRLRNVNLQEYFLYLFFFPSLSAGPIDRVQRFLEDIRSDVSLNHIALGDSIWRLLVGLTKKFVIADTLAIIALNEKLALQVKGSGWMWLVVYLYAFQIFFDFSGYTDIAISLGSIMGVQLPENFKAPYLKPSLKLFWDNWHITLTQWFRTYFFNPISRKLRKQYKGMPVWVFVLTMQFSTMLLIGLWHGVTLNFVIWGIWHGIGLFLENRWSEWAEPRIHSIQKTWVKTALSIGSTFLVFNFVSLGWVWFALPSVKLSTHVFSVLFGS